MSTPKQISGAKIRDARHQAGMTQQALAHAADVSERNIVRWENDHNDPRASHLAAIAQATGQDVDFFYCDGQGAAVRATPFRGHDRRGVAVDRDGAPSGDGQVVTEDAA